MSTFMPTYQLTIQFDASLFAKAGVFLSLDEHPILQRPIRLSQRLAGAHTYVHMLSQTGAPLLRRSDFNELMRGRSYKDFIDCLDDNDPLQHAIKCCAYHDMQDIPGFTPRYNCPREQGETFLANPLHTERDKPVQFTPAMGMKILTKAVALKYKLTTVMVEQIIYLTCQNSGGIPSELGSELQTLFISQEGGAGKIECDRVSLHSSANQASAEVNVTYRLGVRERWTDDCIAQNIPIDAPFMTLDCDLTVTAASNQKRYAVNSYVIKLMLDANDKTHQQILKNVRAKLLRMGYQISEMDLNKDVEDVITIRAQDVKFKLSFLQNFLDSQNKLRSNHINPAARKQLDQLVQAVMRLENALQSEYGKIIHVKDAFYKIMKISAAIKRPSKLYELAENLKDEILEKFPQNLVDIAHDLRMTEPSIANVDAFIDSGAALAKILEDLRSASATKPTAAEILKQLKDICSTVLSLDPPQPDFSDLVKKYVIELSRKIKFQGSSLGTIANSASHPLQQAANEVVRMIMPIVQHRAVSVSELSLKEKFERGELKPGATLREVDIKSILQTFGYKQNTREGGDYFFSSDQVKDPRLLNAIPRKNNTTFCFLGVGKRQDWVLLKFVRTGQSVLVTFEDPRPAKKCKSDFKRMMKVVKKVCHQQGLSCKFNMVIHDNQQIDDDWSRSYWTVRNFLVKKSVPVTEPETIKQKRLKILHAVNSRSIEIAIYNVFDLKVSAMKRPSHSNGNKPKKTISFSPDVKPNRAKPNQVQNTILPKYEEIVTKATAEKIVNMMYDVVFSNQRLNKKPSFGEICANLFANTKTRERLIKSSIVTADHLTYFYAYLRLNFPVKAEKILADIRKDPKLMIKMYKATNKARAVFLSDYFQQQDSYDVKKMFENLQQRLLDVRLNTSTDLQHDVKAYIAAIYFKALEQMVANSNGRTVEPLATLDKLWTSFVAIKNMASGLKKIYLDCVKYFNGKFIEHIFVLSPPATIEELKAVLQSKIFSALSRESQHMLWEMLLINFKSKDEITRDDLNTICVPDFYEALPEKLQKYVVAISDTFVKKFLSQSHTLDEVKDIGGSDIYYRLSEASDLREKLVSRFKQLEYEAQLQFQPAQVAEMSQQVPQIQQSQQPQIHRSQRLRERVLGTLGIPVPSSKWLLQLSVSKWPDCEFYQKLTSTEKADLFNNDAVRTSLLTEAQNLKEKSNHYYFADGTQWTTLHHDIYQGLIESEGVCITEQDYPILYKILEPNLQQAIQVTRDQNEILLEQARVSGRQTPEDLRKVTDVGNQIVLFKPVLFDQSSNTGTLVSDICYENN